MIPHVNAPLGCHWFVEQPSEDADIRLGEFSLQLAHKYHSPHPLSNVTYHSLKPIMQNGIVSVLVCFQERHQEILVVY
jgi:hypothetical protein